MCMCVYVCVHACMCVVCVCVVCMHVWYVCMCGMCACMCMYVCVCVLVSSPAFTYQASSFERVSGCVNSSMQCSNLMGPESLAAAGRPAGSFLCSYTYGCDVPWLHPNAPPPPPHIRYWDVAMAVAMADQNASWIIAALIKLILNLSTMSGF